jgi:hypothetical protein
MSFLRWMIPVVLIACLGGFLVGFLLPKWEPELSCGGIRQCGTASSAMQEHKLQKKTRTMREGHPTLLTSLTVINRGQPLNLVIQTTPGAVCAVRISHGGGLSYPLPKIFANNDGVCTFSLDLPDDIVVGEGSLIVCASACLDKPSYFLIR